MPEKKTRERDTGKTNGHKLALLYTMKYLVEKTDEAHTANASDIAAYLRTRDLKADRRTIYANVAILQDFGLDILQLETGGTGGYYMGSRDFELPELKLLVDAVQSSKFITAKKSEELIAKLSRLTSEAHAQTLSREVFIRNRIKAENESIFYNVDSIYEAIHANCQIAFRYGEITPQKKLVARKGGARYQVSPWALTWDDENYYLIAYDDVAEKIKHYRVDKMLKTTVLSEERLGGEQYRSFDLVEYARKTFGMYGGPDADVVLRCRNALAGVIIDRFGKDVRLTLTDEEHFEAHVKVAVSPQFFGWVTAIGTGMEIKAPDQVRTDYRKYLQEIAKVYSA